MAVLERSNARQGPRSVGHVPGEVGIWVFIVGDLLAFTVMFVAFLVDERRHELTYASAQHLLSVPLGAANTVLLLTGSLFVVAGVRAARAATGRAPLLFGLAFLCGLIFVVNKAVEFTGKFDDGIFPTTNIFFTYFFLMAGVHLLHVVLGMVALAFAAWKTRAAELTADDMRRVENTASYWHLVDILWVVLFPLLYLVH